MNELDRQLAELVGNSPVQWLDTPFPEPVPIRLFLKRDDLLHPQVSGNKWRKLKYNLRAAQDQGFTTLLTLWGRFLQSPVRNGSGRKGIWLSDHWRCARGGAGPVTPKSNIGILRVTWYAPAFCLPK